MANKRPTHGSSIAPIYPRHDRRASLLTAALALLVATAPTSFGRPTLPQDVGETPKDWLRLSAPQGQGNANGLSLSRLRQLPYMPELLQQQPSQRHLDGTAGPSHGDPAVPRERVDLSHLRFPSHPFAGLPAASHGASLTSSFASNSARPPCKDAGPACHAGRATTHLTRLPSSSFPPVRPGTAESSSRARWWKRPRQVQEVAAAPHVPTPEDVRRGKMPKIEAVEGPSTSARPNPVVVAPTAHANTMHVPWSRGRSLPSALFTNVGVAGPSTSRVSPPHSQHPHPTPAIGSAAPLTGHPTSHDAINSHVFQHWVASRPTQAPTLAARPRLPGVGVASSGGGGGGGPGACVARYLDTIYASHCQVARQRAADFRRQLQSDHPPLDLGRGAGAVVAGARRGGRDAAGDVANVPANRGGGGGRVVHTARFRRAGDLPREGPQQQQE